MKFFNFADGRALIPMRLGSSLILLFCGFLVLTQPTAFGSLQLSSNVGISNLQLVPVSGTVVFSDPWTSEAFAQAQNSLGELDQQFDTQTGASAVANASATFTSLAHGDADGLSLTSNAAITLGIAGTTEAVASGLGSGTLYNSFMITGGVGDVDVTFSLAMTGGLQVMTDAFGQQAEAELIVNMLLDGDSVLFYTDSLSVGPGSSASPSVSQSLTQTRTLQYGTSYFLLFDTHTNLGGTNTIPEPSTALIGSMLLGVIALTTLHRLRTAGRVSP